MRYSAVIFDLDGTLLDTERLTWDAGKSAFAEQGIEIDEDLFAQLVGKDKETGGAILRARFGDLDIDLLDRHWGQAARALYADGIPLKPGARDVIARADELDLPKAIATSSQHKDAHHKLKTTGLDLHFDTVVTFQCVAAPKPAPDPYLLAAERLGVDAAACLVFEDSETGDEAAHRAGCRVVQVPDVIATQGRFAHHVAGTLIDGARAAGLMG